ISRVLRATSGRWPWDWSGFPRMMADPPDRTKMSSNSKPRVLIDTVQRHVLADKPR
ncbi:unnamed protein product, partial [Musa acuminata subsp. burmannicoides]